jgi:hypothetical protein
MNQIFFCIRIILGLLFLGLGIFELSEKNILLGFTDLSISLVVAAPAIIILHKKQELLRASLLFKNLDAFKLIEWGRSFSGFVFAFAGMGGLDTKESGAPGFIIVGLFLLSPISSKVFVYGPRVYSSRAKLPWNFNIAMLVVQRTIGIFFLLAGYIAFTENDISSGIIATIFSLIMIFIYQIKRLFTKNNYQLLGNPSAGSGSNDGYSGASKTSIHQLAELKAEYLDLTNLPAQMRGYAFQEFLQRFFDAHHITARGPFRLTGEEIDGSFELDAFTYLVEAKWQAKPCSQSDLLVFNGKVEGKSMWSRGIFISHAGFTGDGLKAFANGKRTSIIGMDGNDLMMILEGHVNLIEGLKAKLRGAAEKNEFFVPLNKMLLIA